MDIYVGNLSRTTTQETLRALFEAYGTVSAVKIIMDKFTGQPRGFGFVTMPEQGEAEAAIAALDGQEVDGRAIRANQANPQTERPRRDSRGGGNGNGGGFQRSSRPSSRGGSRY